ncbi:Transcriptional regulatory protein LiaR [bioreactor metagenome]|uniref:Transcriptional regulatory protein LiaR n=1 Tax=bioreactor metagenome TaxID=1076179 RepID=A0A645CUD2_9ZZZZ|nr:response regulator transcription factor [Anaerolineaceae bacterium]
MSEKIRLLMVDDYPVVLSGLVAMFKNHDEIEVIGVANNGKKAIDLATTMHPHVILMNVAMPGMDGIEATRTIKRTNPEINILMFSGLSSNDKVMPALNAGAIGYILKDASEGELVQAIRQVAKGEAWLHPSIIGHVLKQLNGTEEQEGLIEKLTERELDVLKYMAKGYSNQEIAKLMVVSTATVHSHVSRILAKLEVSSRTQAVIYAMRAGVVTAFDDEPTAA